MDDFDRSSRGESYAKIPENVPSFVSWTGENHGISFARTNTISPKIATEPEAK